MNLEAVAHIFGEGQLAANVINTMALRAVVTANGSLSAIPYKFGEEWGPVADEANTWVPVPAESNVWTEIQPGQNTWQ